MDNVEKNEDPADLPDSIAGDVEDREAAFEESLYRQRPVLWFTTLIGPIAAVPALLIGTGFVAGWALAHRLALTIMATALFFGRFMILAGDNGADGDYSKFFSPAQLALLVFFLDTATAVLVAFHMNVLFRLPLIGERLRVLVQDGRTLVKSQRWMKRLTVAGVIAFVMFPLAATGSLGGSILGRLLGLSHAGTLAAVMTGSVLGCGVMYFGAGLITTYVDRDDPVVQAVGIGVIVALIVLLTLRYRKLTKTVAS